MNVIDRIDFPFCPQVGQQTCDTECYQTTSLNVFSFDRVPWCDFIGPSVAFSVIGWMMDLVETS